MDGYEEHGDACFPINNCEATDNGNCQGNAQCVYTGPGSSMCVCPAGYQLQTDGSSCAACSGDNCYAPCQFVDDAELKSVVSTKTDVTLRFVSIKTSDLAAYFSDSNERILVITHQLTISGRLELPTAKVAFFANEILQEPGARIELNTNNAARTAVAQVDSNRKLSCANQYAGFDPWPGPIKGAVLNIYVTGGDAPFHCSGNYNARDVAIQAAIKSKSNAKISPFDSEFFTMALDCAKVVAQEGRFAKDNRALLRGSLPVRLTQHVLDEIRKAKSDDQAITDAVETLRLKAINLMENLSLRAKGVYVVPYLSLKAHEKILVLLKDDAKMAIDKYARFERISQDFTARMEATDSMTQLMTAIVRRNDLDIDALEQELVAAESDREAMKGRFDQAKRELTTAEATFKQGVRDYQNKMIANAVFSVLGGITTAFAGGAGSVLGFTVELASLADDVGRISRVLFKISIVMDTLAKIAEASKEFTSLNYDILPYAKSGPSDYYSKKLPEENDQSLAVMIKEWDEFDAAAEAFLGQGTAANDISGTSEYLAALRTVAVWGKGYHEKSITVQELMNTLIKLKKLKCEQDEAKQNIEASQNQLSEATPMNGELLIAMALQKQRLRNIMVDQLMSFCDSYFYNWLSDCPVTPTLADDLYELHGKINQGLSAVINAVENFAPFIPQAFEDTIVITQDNAKCTAQRNWLVAGQRRRDAHAGGKRSGGAYEPAMNTLLCPISELKRTNSFFYQVTRDNAGIFQGHERVHVDEVEVHFVGLNAPGKEITAQVSFNGLMKVRKPGVESVVGDIKLLQKLKTNFK